VGKYIIRKTPTKGILMGTRNLTKVIDSTGTTRVAQYGQWDGYPSGQGLSMLAFISEHRMLEKIERSLRKVHFLSEDEAETFMKDFSSNGMMTMEQSESFEAIYPSLSRNTGSDILKVMVYSTGYTLPLIDNSDFESDELFCEGVYTLDFQSREFISNYGKTVKFSFDSLPTADEYLKSFEEDLTNA
jgi:hypothetical protein